MGSEVGRRRGRSCSYAHGGEAHIFLHALRGPEGRSSTVTHSFRRFAAASAPWAAIARLFAAWSAQQRLDQAAISKEIDLLLIPI